MELFLESRGLVKYLKDTELLTALSDLKTKTFSGEVVSNELTSLGFTVHSWLPTWSNQPYGSSPFVS